MASAPSPIHLETVQRIHRIFDRRVEDGGAGAVLVAPLEVVLPAGQVVWPDLVWIATGNPGLRRGGRFEGIPDIVVEAISPTGRSQGRLTRGMRYAASGVAEYWVIEPDLQNVFVYGLVAGVYEERPIDADGTVSSGVLPGLQVNPTTLFEHVDPAIRRRGGET